MAENYRAIKWLLEELPKLRETQVMDEATAGRVREYYGKKLESAPSPQKYLLVCLVVIGGVLISGGVILLFAHNWDMLSRPVRVGLAFLPLVLAVGLSAYALLTKLDDARWREFGALSSAAGIAVATALVSQIYHSDGTLAGYMRLILALALPLVWIFRSFSLLTVYSLGLFMTLEWRDSGQWINLIYLGAGIVTVLYYLWREKESRGAAFMRYLLIPQGIFGIFLMEGHWWQPVLFALLALGFVAGQNLKKRGVRRFANPWLWVSWLGWTIFLAIGSSTNYFWRFKGEFNMTVLLALLIPVLVGGVVLAARQATPEKVVAILFPFLVISAAIWGDCQVWLLVLANIYLVVFGGLQIRQGFLKFDLVEFNLGMIQVMLFCICRFFDSDIGILERAVGFILLGVMAIAVNIFLSYRFKKVREVSHD